MCRRQNPIFQVKAGVVGGWFHPRELENNLYLDKGRLVKGGGEQVMKIVRTADEHGLEQFTPTKTSRILNLKGPDKFKFYCKLNVFKY